MPKITELFAFVCEDDGPDDEGIVGFYHQASGAMMPLVGADMSRVDSIRTIAQGIGRQTGKRIRLLRFAVREELELLDPKYPSRPA